MQIPYWTILAILIPASITIYLAVSKGELKTIELYVSPSRLKRKFKLNFFSKKGHKLPAVGVINFFVLPKPKHKRICFHLYFTVENLSKHPVEEASIILTYPRKYFDENDKDFFKLTGEGQRKKTEYMFLDDETMQVVYTYPSLHPKSGYQIIHPIIISIDECLKPLDIEHPLYFDISQPGFSFDMIGYIVSAKNLKKPIKSYFWMINVLQTPYMQFFNREKKFLHAITKDFALDKYVFEQREIDVFKEGKFKKDVLVVPLEKMKVTYSHFPPLKEPNSGRFNFKKEKM